MTPVIPGAAVAAGGRWSPPDRRRVQPSTERQSGEDHELVDGVVALDVTARIGLGVAQFLGIHEDVVVWAALLRHGGQDVVRRAVDDPADAPDLVAGQVQRQRRQDGDPPGHRRLEPEGGARPASGSLEFGAVVRDHVLVRRDHGLAGAERSGDEGATRLVTTHDLHDDVDPRIRHEMGRRVGEERRRKAARSRALEVPDGDAAKLDHAAVGAGDPFRMERQAIDHRPTDVARSEHADAKRGAAHGRAA